MSEHERKQLDLMKQQNEGFMIEVKRILARRQLIHDAKLNPDQFASGEAQEGLRMAIIEEERCDPEEVRQMLFVANNRVMVQMGTRQPIRTGRPSPGSNAAKNARDAAIYKARCKTEGHDE